jgi:hypothetical protein
MKERGTDGSIETAVVCNGWRIVESGEPKVSWTEGKIKNASFTLFNDDGTRGTEIDWERRDKRECMVSIAWRLFVCIFTEIIEKNGKRITT